MLSHYFLELLAMTEHNADRFMAGIKDPRMTIAKSMDDDIKALSFKDPNAAKALTASE